MGSGYTPHSFIISFLLVLLLLAYAPSTVDAAISTTTYDDTSSAFSFTGSWTATSQSNPCNYCSSKPNASRAFGGTWHDGNYRSGASEATGGSFTFTGTAVAIYGIDQAGNQPNIVFTLGNTKSTHHYTGTEQFAYDALFFSADGLSQGTHTVTWNFETNPSGVEVQAALFDYAVVTSGSADPVVLAPTGNDATTTTTPTTSPQDSDTTTKETRSSSPAATDSAKASVNSSSPVSRSTSVATTSDTNSPSFTLSASSSANTPSNVLGTTVPNETSASSSNHPNIGAIVGGILAAVFLIILAFIILLLCRRRRRQRRAEADIERVAAGLPPLPPQPNMRRIRAGNYTIKPFVDDRATAVAGDVLTQGAYATESSASDGMSRNISVSTTAILQPLRRGASISEPSPVTPSESTPSLSELPLSPPPPFDEDTGAAVTTVQHPADKGVTDGASDGQAGPSSIVTRQPSQMSQFGGGGYIGEKRPIDTNIEADRSTIFSSSASPSTYYSSARERYLEERLATLEAHVASYLPPPYENAEPPPAPVHVPAR
ncbi:hypothetical protein MKEN_01130500 [Mycena kentingensis (nom. inval.)]|nr:hypothetical protein MKEN_01130500 [Mycena kentingensis (nom. inval.)]